MGTLVTLKTFCLCFVIISYMAAPLCLTCYMCISVLILLCFTFYVNKLQHLRNLYGHVSCLAFCHQCFFFKWSRLILSFHVSKMATTLWNEQNNEEVHHLPWSVTFFCSKSKTTRKRAWNKEKHHKQASNQNQKSNTKWVNDKDTLKQKLVLSGCKLVQKFPKSKCY